MFRLRRVTSFPSADVMHPGVLTLQMHDAKAEARSYDPGMADPDDMMSSVASSLQARTGRTLDEWVRTVADGGIDPLDQLAVRRWLRDEHGVPQNSQWAIADAAARAAGWSRPSVDEYIDTHYSGARAALRPIFDHIDAIATALGDDVSVEGRSTYTPYVRGGSSPPSPRQPETGRPRAALRRPPGVRSTRSDPGARLEHAQDQPRKDRRGRRGGGIAAPAGVRAERLRSAEPGVDESHEPPDGDGRRGGDASQRGDVDNEIAHRAVRAYPDGQHR